MSTTRPGTLYNIILLLLIFLYIYTAAAKLLSHEKHQAVLSHLPLIGNYSALISWGVPLAEILIAVLLLFPRTHSAGLYLSLFLLVLFTIYIIYLLFSAVRLPCTCGGVLEKMTWKQHVLFNAFFITLNMVAVKSKRSTTIHQPSSKDIHA